MNWFTGCVLYVLIWWTVLFAVLPFGNRSSPDPDPASGWRGAPQTPRIGRKVLITTAISAVIFAGCYALITSDWVSFRHGWFALPED